MTRTCPCGARHDEDDHRLVGGQVLGEGDVLVLANAPCCGTTYVIAELTDAAVCEAQRRDGTPCGRIVTGEAALGDVKVIGCSAVGPIVVCCLDCARRDFGPTAFLEPPMGLRTRLPRAARMYG